MSKVLVVGNVTKDVYLRLDNRQNRFESDERGVEWLDLGFDGDSHQYFRRVAVHGGAAVSREVLTKMGVEVEGGQLTEDITATYRYILCKDDEVAYFAPSERNRTVWQAPNEAIDFVYIDRSAEMTPAVAKEILAYLNLAAHTKLVVYAGKKSAIPTELIMRAEIVLADEEAGINKGGIIRKDFIEFGGIYAEWSVGGKAKLMTDLTTRSTIAATLVGGKILGMSGEECVKMAVANVENATLNETVGLSKLKEMMMDVSIWPADKMNGGGAQTNSLSNTAREMMKKGILAADESGGSIKKKFESMNIIDDERHRRDYRNIFFTTPELAEYASGVILFDETARQKADNGQNFVEFLRDKGLMVGVAAGQGYEDWPDGGKVTFGLDGLAERLREYYKMGVRFMKWRAPFEVGNTPESLIAEAAKRLATYAKECQRTGLVPIVEPEIVHDGDFSIEQCAELTARVLDKLFEELAGADIDLAGCVLKVNMVLAGKKFVGGESAPEEVGKATAEVLRAHVPGGLAGVVFLSGGQGVEQATENLRAICAEGPFPWPVTFSFARALQDPALEAWKGDNANIEAARRAFAARLVANAEAAKTPVK
jgi:fructose-bisphosphate aldolase class I